MGLKESGLRGSLRNVSVGIDAIPDGYPILQALDRDSQIEAQLEDDE